MSHARRVILIYAAPPEYISSHNQLIESGRSKQETLFFIGQVCTQPSASAGIIDRLPCIKMMASHKLMSERVRSLYSPCVCAHNANKAFSESRQFPRAAAFGLIQLELEICIAHTRLRQFWVAPGPCHAIYARKGSNLANKFFNVNHLNF